MRLALVYLFIFCHGILQAQNASPRINRVITFSGKLTGAITRSEVENARLEVMIQNGGTLVLDTVYTVVSFKLSVYTKGPLPPITNLSGTGNTLTQRMKDAILARPAGTKVYFEYLIAGRKNAPQLKMLPLAFELSN